MPHQAPHPLNSVGFSTLGEVLPRGIGFAIRITVLIPDGPRCAPRTGFSTVNQRLVAEFTALVASQAPLIIEGSAPLSDGPLWVYWQHSKSLWPRRRHELEELLAGTSSHAPGEQHVCVKSVASDILIGEMFTRVAGAVLTACDRRRRLRRAEPIARNMLAVHQQCRATVLRLLLHSTCLPADDLAELDRLRRRVERWTDVLIGPLLAHYGDELGDFAFDHRRACDFGSEQLDARLRSLAQPTWSFLLAGLRSAFPNDPTPTSPKDPVYPILRSILALFPDDAFRPEGPIQSLRLTRLSRSSHQVERPPESDNAGSQILRLDRQGHARRMPLGRHHRHS
jgi:hypothetical protein